MSKSSDINKTFIPSAKNKCVWDGFTATDDEAPQWENTWATGCGELHEFTSGGPSDNMYKWCPYCRNEIEESK